MLPGKMWTVAPVVCTRDKHPASTAASGTLPLGRALHVANPTSRLVPRHDRFPRFSRRMGAVIVGSVIN